MASGASWGVRLRLRALLFSHGSAWGLPFRALMLKNMETGEHLPRAVCSPISRHIACQTAAEQSSWLGYCVPLHGGSAVCRGRETGSRGPAPPSLHAAPQLAAAQGASEQRLPAGYPCAETPSGPASPLPPQLFVLLQVHIPAHLDMDSVEEGFLGGGGKIIYHFIMQGYINRYNI